METKSEQKKFKIWWFSKAGKITLWVILWIIVWVFAIIWMYWTKVFYTQLQDETWWWEFASASEMVVNIVNEIDFPYSWWGSRSDIKFNIFWIDIYSVPEEERWKTILERALPGLEKWRVITIDNDFSWTEINESPYYVYLKFPYESNKFFNSFWEHIYGDEVNERWDPITIWNRVYEIKIELKNAKNFHWSQYLYNSHYEHFRQKSVSYQPYLNFQRYPNSTEPLKEWETACIILTPLNPITATDKALHDEWCEFWPLEMAFWYDELYLEFMTQRNTESELSPEIKITPISIDIPIITWVGKTSR